MQVRLADEDGARGPQAGDARRVLRGHPPHADARRGSRFGAAHVHEVLDRERHPVQRAAVAARRELAVGLARLTPRLVRHYQDERVGRRIARLDLRQALLDDGLGRYRVAREASRQTPESSCRQRFTEMATPSRSGTMDVSSAGCSLRRTL